MGFTKRKHSQWLACRQALKVEANDAKGSRKEARLKRIASKRIHATRFRLLFLCMSLSQNRCALLGDMHFCACRYPKTAAHFWATCIRFKSQSR